MYIVATIVKDCSMYIVATIVKTHTKFKSVSVTRPMMCKYRQITLDIRSAITYRERGEIQETQESHYQVCSTD